MASLEPEEPVRLPLLRMGWRRQAFVHWAFDPDVVQRLLPPSLEADLYQGQAWVSFTPFVMADIQPAVLPPLPGLRRLATFPETNLRTYVRGPHGHDGLWFMSIEAASALMTIGARTLIGAPYHLADLAVSKHGPALAYTGHRRGGQPSYRLRLRPGEPLEPSPLEVWLTSRWRAYTRRWGILLHTPVRHEPWPLTTAVAHELDQTLTTAAGLPRPTTDPIVHYSPGVTVHVGPTRPERP
jgi:uncharacterized protein YqjF (DUF2071 family)